MKRVSCIFRLTCLFFVFCKAGYSQNELNNSDKLYNPVYHFYPSIDPTGLFYFDGKYFLNWGSAESDDLVHWRMTEYGLERIELISGIFGNDGSIAPFGVNSPIQSQVISIESGSAIVDWNNTTGLSQNGHPAIIAFQSRGIAYSNDSAKNWIKYENPPTIENSTGSGDPKVFWYEPDKKWVLIMGWTSGQKIKFFSSKDLKDWKYMSEFGPWGAVTRAWNCVDFFPLAVDGNPSNIKWVLVISVQTFSGQYFVGDFDGTRFTLDQQYINELSYDAYQPSGTMLFNFERGIDDWGMEGDAFIECPSNAEISGKEGKRFINSAHNQSSSKGKITSPEFTISNNCINFLVGGGYYPNDECINLLIDGKVVRTQTGTNNASLTWNGWDVSEFRGKQARIEIVDNITEAKTRFERGYIYCDAIMLCDELPPEGEYNSGWEKAFWADWGTDFYAARSWSNYPQGETRNIWVGWMGNHLYRSNEPLFGLISVPRSIELKTFPEGIRLIQNPVKELESLRTAHLTAETNTFEGIWKPRKFMPEKNSYELIVEFENISAEEFGLKLCIGENEKTVVGYKVSEEELYVDRRNSGYDEFSSDFSSINRGPLKNRSDKVRLHIFIDKCSIEVFANNGEISISSKIYPDPSSLGIELFSNNGKVTVSCLDLWELGSIHLY